MKKVRRDVKSHGKVLSTIEIEQFDTIKEASDKLGAEKALAIINKAVARAAINAERVAKTRKTSAISTLGRMIKEDPSLAAEIEVMIAKRKKA